MSEINVRCTCIHMDGNLHNDPSCSVHIKAPKGLDQIDLRALMAEPNPHGGCPDAGCGPYCPARIWGR